MEEQRQRQEDEARRTGGQAGTEVAGNPPAVVASSNEDAMLERALAMSMDQPSTPNVVVPNVASSLGSVYPDFATMTEEEQIAYAMQMSMQEARKKFKYI